MFATSCNYFIMKPVQLLLATLICIGHLTISITSQNINYFGVAYSPYVKPAGTQWNQYSIDEIKRMLRIILSNNHNSIATYGMGVGWYNEQKPWDQADANCLIARAAAQVNRENNAVVLSVAQGINQHDDSNRQQREIDNAFSAVQDANGIRPGTVWGLVFTNEYVTSVENGRKVLQMIQNNKRRAQQLGIRVGTRIHVCGQIWGGELQGILIEIAKVSDFIMCNIYPAQTNNIDNAITQVNNGYFSARDGFWRHNSRLEVQIGETGWASQGQSYFNPPENNNINNLKNFWIQMRNWANNNRVKVAMFEAFDEPWKGGNEGERNFGWWKRANDNSDAYIEKATGRRV